VGISLNINPDCSNDDLEGLRQADVVQSAADYNFSLRGWALRDDNVPKATRAVLSSAAKCAVGDTITAIQYIMYQVALVEFHINWDLRETISAKRFLHMACAKWATLRRYPHGLKS
jgi:hypothetical protein